MVLPNRCIPVSTFRCIDAVFPAASAACASALPSSLLSHVTVRLCSIAKLANFTSTGPIMRIGFFRPIERSSIPSAIV